MVAGMDGNSLPMLMALIQVQSIQGQSSSCYLQALFDTGSTTSLAHRQILPQGATANQIQGRTLINTAAGIMKPIGIITIDKLRLPEFNRNAIIDTHMFKVFTLDCQFDLILGTDFLSKSGINIMYRSLEVSAFGVTLTMSSLQPTASIMKILDTSLQMEDDIEFIGEDVFTTQIADTKYKEVDPRQLVEEAYTHLSSLQKKQLLHLLV